MIWEKKDCKIDHFPELIPVLSFLGHFETEFLSFFTTLINNFEIVLFRKIYRKISEFEP